MKKELDGKKVSHTSIDQLTGLLKVHFMDGTFSILTNEEAWEAGFKKEKEAEEKEAEEAEEKEAEEAEEKERKIKEDTATKKAVSKKAGKKAVSKKAGKKN